MSMHETVKTQQISKLLSFYTETLSKEFANKLLTPAVQLLVERRLMHLQFTKQQEEPQSELYKLPVKVIFDVANFRFDVVLMNENKE